MFETMFENGLLLGAPEIPGLSDNPRHGGVKGILKAGYFLPVASPAEYIHVFRAPGISYYRVVACLFPDSIFRTKVAVPAGEGVVIIHFLYALMAFQA
jgi:hypothetical protein